ncbi:hypothetical protein M758_10G146300 [Ceratodon purpureus]|nr:hypothetical protein M758_10G146300 [Ceratodon purpureus]
MFLLLSTSLVLAYCTKRMYKGHFHVDAGVHSKAVYDPLSLARCRGWYTVLVCTPNVHMIFWEFVAEVKSDRWHQGRF